MKTGIITCLMLLIISTAIRSQNAPVTITGRVTNAIPGDPAVPVAITVMDFNDIAQFTLTIKFDTTRVRLVSSSTNPSLPGMNITYIHPSGNTTGKLVFTWSWGDNISLANGSAIADLVFHYVTGTGNLTWAYTFGSICQYKRWSGGALITLADSPKYSFYENGGISYREAPVVYAPIIGDPVPGSLSLPLTVNGFTNISAFTYYLEYDPAIIIYSGTFVKNPAFDSNFLVGDIPGSGGKRCIVIQWFGAPVNLANESTLCTLIFSYPEAICNSGQLRWYDTGPSCEYSDANGDILIDMPKNTYFFDGLIAPGLPVIWTGNVSSQWADPGNWTSCGTPEATRDVVIPDVSPNPYPVIINATHCKSINIEPGANLTISTGGLLIVEE